MAVAGLIGVSSIASFMVWNPQAQSQAAEDLLDRARLRHVLADYVSAEGLPWLQRASPQEICSRLLTYSNATLSLSAVVDSVPCEVLPAAGQREVNMTLDLGSRMVVLLAWSSGEQ